MNKYYYETPDGISNLLLEFQDEFLVGADFVDLMEEEKVTEINYISPGKLGISESCINASKNIKDTKNWFDLYFSGEVPKFVPKIALNNVTDFQRQVLKILMGIPYGNTITYSEIAARIAKQRGIKKMSAQAVGGAVGKNPVSIIIPCHRVIGQDGSLTGYGGGLNNKKKLLEIEGIL